MNCDAVNKTDVADFPLNLVMNNRNAGVTSKKVVTFTDKYVSLSVVLR